MHRHQSWGLGVATPKILGWRSRGIVGGRERILEKSGQTVGVKGENVNI